MQSHTTKGSKLKKVDNRPSFAACSYLVQIIEEETDQYDHRVPRCIGKVNQQFQGGNGTGFEIWDGMDLYDALMFYSMPMGTMSREQCQQWWNVAKFIRDYEQSRPLDAASQRALDLIRSKKDGATLDEICMELQQMQPVVEERLRSMVRLGLVARGRPEARDKSERGTKPNMTVKTVYMASKAAK